MTMERMRARRSEGRGLGRMDWASEGMVWGSDMAAKALATEAQEAPVANSTMGRVDWLVARSMS